MNHAPLLLALLLLALPISVAQSEAWQEHWPHADGWPFYGGNLRHASVSPVAGPAQRQDAASPATLDQRSFTSPVLDAAGHVYVGDEGGSVYKLRPDLTLVWKSAALGGALRASVALDGQGTVYAAPVHKDLVALEAATGAVRWRADVGNVVASGYVLTAAPIVHPEGFIVQSTLSGKVQCVRPDGTIRNTFTAETSVGGLTLDSKVVASPAVGSDGTIYVGSQNGVLYALAPADCSRKASFRTNAIMGNLANSETYEQQVASPSIAPDGTVYVTTRLKRGEVGRVYALTPELTLKWSVPLQNRITAPVAIAKDGALFIGAHDGTFARLNPQDGAVVWEFFPATDDPALGSEGTGVLAVAEQALVDGGGRVYVGYWHVPLNEFPPQDSLASPFYALNTQDGSIVWRHTFPKTVRTPAMLPGEASGNAPRGVLYLAGDDAKLYAVGTAQPRAPALGGDTTSPTPTPTAEPTQETTPTPTPSPGSSDPPKDTPALAALAVLAVVGLAAARRRA